MEEDKLECPEIKRLYGRFLDICKLDGKTCQLELGNQCEIWKGETR